MARETDNTPSIHYMKPDQAREHLRLDRHDGRLNLGITRINREAGSSEIIINADLPEPIQQVILEHERVQLDIITAYIELLPGRKISDVMPYAHRLGLQAGIALAEELGVLDQYMKLRKLEEQPQEYFT